MIVRFGPWNKEKVASFYIIISFIWLLSITILFPFYQVACLASSKTTILRFSPQNSNLIQIFDVSTPQLYVGCFFTPRFNGRVCQNGNDTNSFLSSQAVFFNYLVIAALARSPIP